MTTFYTEQTPEAEKPHIKHCFNGTQRLHPAIRAQHAQALDMIRGAPDGMIGLYDCFVDGKPTTAIVAVLPHPNGVALTPLFIAPTDEMEIDSHSGERSKDWDEVGADIMKHAKL